MSIISISPDLDVIDFQFDPGETVAFIYWYPFFEGPFPPIRSTSHTKRFSKRRTPRTRTMTSDTAMTDVESTVKYPHLILPGELLSTILSQPLKLGPGLRHSTSPNGETLIQATQAGLLHKTKHSEFYVDYNSRRVETSPSNVPYNFSFRLAFFCGACSQ